MLRHFRLIIAAVLVITFATSAALVEAQRAAEVRLSGATNRATTARLLDPGLIREYQQLITPESLASRLYFLASDALEGRETSTRGQKIAAEYLASQYRQLGLAPRGTERPADARASAAFYQSFTLYKRAPRKTHLEISVNGDKVASSDFSAETHDELSYFLTGGQIGATGNVVFAGYGIADDKLQYNDYSALAAKGISLKDKWVLILQEEPLANSSTSLLPTADHKPSSWTTQFLQKRYALWEAGLPSGVLVVSDIGPRATTTFEEASRQASMGLLQVGGLSLSQTAPFPPTLAISSKLANQILASSGRTIADLRKEIDSTLTPTVFEVDKSVSVTASVEPFTGVTTENVLAFIEGSDPQLKNEVLIISAHYDHLGRNPNLKGDQIFNGAADDGSGVVASIQLAELFMKAKRDGYGPRRSILIANFSGEEKGTLGSAYYSNNPVVPWEQTVADINMDGVAGIDPKHPDGSKNYIYLVGTKDLSTELADITRNANRTLGTKIDLTDGPPFNSDHYHFATRMIPFLYFSTGSTEKYHRVDDEPNTVDYEHFARVVRLTLAAAWQVANQDHTLAKTDRRFLKLAGYVCQPCPYACDAHLFESPGECPVCGMTLVPKYTVVKAADSTNRLFAAMR